MSMMSGAVMKFLHDESKDLSKQARQLTERIETHELLVLATAVLTDAERKILRMLDGREGGVIKADDVDAKNLGRLGLINSYQTHHLLPKGRKCLKLLDKMDDLHLWSMP